ncbi:hypothetical protein [Vibrio gallaecicus]|uniref:hypothetical protein n=1 Tax=Vibrio gallaecicus TaxID=552386 RepID=UPI0025B389A2|nr:hypothetical protein [Vibrio gallaecicus]MDN3616627.1 hypothetical protein [Vibrio gallaecicus]
MTSTSIITQLSITYSGGFMKHFLPSSVMLTPFLVKYYDEEPEGNSELSSDEDQNENNEVLETTDK